MSSKVTSWHRRQAMQLAIQLPEEREDAQKVVNCIQRYLVKFLYGPPAPRPPGDSRNQRVVPFPPGSGSKRRISSNGKASTLPK
jgi:hypothetical protein